ncbi:MAG: hypothetical protein LBR06_05175 [Bacteroidales bacterium]|jgi:hypothetical protein|nr:hypothetical protein [Bacteroidales bacterium]
MKNSGLISLPVMCLLLAGLCSHAQTPFPTDKQGTQRYRTIISHGATELSGLLAVKFSANEWRGTMMNEFGIKAFDFIASKGKCRLKNVVPMMNKWYIRKTVERDLHSLLWDYPAGKQVKNRQLEMDSDGAFRLINTKRKITYSFHPFPHETDR